MCVSARERERGSKKKNCRFHCHQMENLYTKSLTHTRADKICRKFDVVSFQLNAIALNTITYHHYYYIHYMCGDVFVDASVYFKDLSTISEIRLFFVTAITAMEICAAANETKTFPNSIVCTNV